MRQAAAMQVVECLGQPQADIDARCQIHACDGDRAGIRSQRARFILDGVDVRAAAHIIAELHDIVVKRNPIRAAPHVQDVYQARMVARDRLEFQDPLKLTLKSARILKILAPYHFHRPQRPGHATSKPDLPVSSTANLTQNLMIRDERIRP